MVFHEDQTIEDSSEQERQLEKVTVELTPSQQQLPGGEEMQEATDNLELPYDDDDAEEDMLA